MEEADAASATAGLGHDGYQTITYAASKTTLVLTLARPTRLNAMNDQLLAELMHALNRADADDTTRALVVTGAGRGFCAGPNIAGGTTTFDYRSPQLGEDDPDDRGGTLALRLMRMNKPVIAAINGPAAGTGASLTQPMDIRLASTESPPPRIRVRPSRARAGVMQQLAAPAHRRHRGQALGWISKGRVCPTSAPEAVAGEGPVSRLHPPGELLGAAMSLAEEIARHCAGVGQAGSVEPTSPEVFQRTFATNVYGTHNLLRAVLPQLRPQRDPGRSRRSPLRELFRAGPRVRRTAHRGRRSSICTKGSRWNSHRWGSG